MRSIYAEPRTPEEQERWHEQHDGGGDGWMPDIWWNAIGRKSPNAGLGLPATTEELRARRAVELEAPRGNQ